MPTAPVVDSFERLRTLERKRFDAERKGRVPVMDAETLRELCLDNEGYETPELNDSLYAHFRGFQRIEGLAPYRNLKALWLESNGLSRIEGLSSLVHLRCLYLSKNLISAVENLEALRALNTLDLSENRLTTLDGLAQLPLLASLNVSRNQLSRASALRALEACAELTNLDVSHNQIDDDEDGASAVLRVLARVPQLKALRITGNPVVSRTKHFRKAFLSAMPQLAFLDRPVFPIERAAVAAWARGGNDAELQAKRAFVERENDERKRSLHEFRAWQAQVRERRLLEIEQEKARKRAEAPPPPVEADAEVEELHNFRAVTEDEYRRLDAAERAKWDERIRQARADSARDRREVLGGGIAPGGRAKFWADSAPIDKRAERSPEPEPVGHAAAATRSLGASADGGRRDADGSERRQRDAGETDGAAPGPRPPHDDATTATATATATITSSTAVPSSMGCRWDTPPGRAGRGSPVERADVEGPPPLEASLASASSPLRLARITAEQDPSCDRATADGAPALRLPPAPVSLCGAPEQRQPSATEAHATAAEPVAAAQAVDSTVEAVEAAPTPSRLSVFPGPNGTEPRETWAQLQRRACASPCLVRPPSLPSVFADTMGGKADGDPADATDLPERALTRAEILRELRAASGGDKEAAAALPPAPFMVGAAAAAASSATSPFTNVGALD